MARQVVHTAREPRIVTPEDIDEEHGDVAVCQCGLSEEYPFCDGSHRVTHDEAEGVVYEYEGDDPEGGRRAVGRLGDVEGEGEGVRGDRAEGTGDDV
ncbi:(Fe-S) protein [Halobacteriales archaeon QS_5_70_17]|nr:MAG: (Fe-S) protein [Halobacteriales archaeon QS_5_70_17]